MSKDTNNNRYKIERLIEKYELEGLGEELEHRWTRSEDRQGLRQLEEYVNHRVLRAALTAAGDDPLEGEVEHLYRLLTDDVSSAVRTQVRHQLEEKGIDADSLENDFVSYQSIYTYLVNEQDAEPPDETPSEKKAIEGKHETIQRLKTRLNKVTTRSLGELRNAAHLTLGEFSVLITIRVHCLDCDTRQSVSELLTQGGCQCGSGAEG